MAHECVPDELVERVLLYKGDKITTTLNKEEDYLCEEENYLGDLVYCVDEGLREYLKNRY